MRPSWIARPVSARNIDRADREEVGARVDSIALPLGLLRRHVRRPFRGRCPVAVGEPLIRGSRSRASPKSSTFTIPVLREEQVAGLDVAMDDVARVERREDVEHLIGDREDVAERQDLARRAPSTRRATRPRGAP